MKKYLPLLFAFLTLVFFLPPLTVQKTQAAITPNFAPNEVVVKFKTNASEGEKNALKKAFSATTTQKIEKLHIEVLKVPDAALSHVLQALQNNPHVVYAEPNFEAEKVMLTNDPSLSQQWGLFQINAANSDDSAWDVASGSSSVKVAILDTGVESTHSDLVGKVVANANFTTSPTASDLDGHGTHVAGIVAAGTNNAKGVAGTGYNTSLLNGKVLNDNGSGYYSWITNGIVWATDQGAQVISMSLSGSSSSQALSDAINYAWSKGVVIVAAAGNSNSNTPVYPAYYANVIAVAATDDDDERASFSNFGNWVDVAAPGVSIYSTYKGNSYISMSGTSMATPFAAGTAALVWAKGICNTNVCVRNQIEKTADDIDGTGTYWTQGRINAYNAVTTVIPTPFPTNTPTPTLTPTPTRTPTPTFTPTPTPTRNMTVGQIAMSYTIVSSSSRRITTTITVVNRETNAPLSNVNVDMELVSPSGDVEDFSNRTSSTGKVTFSDRSSEKGVFTARVTGVSRSGYLYFPTLTSNTLLVQ